jgi:hypothetical protein
MGEHSNLLSTFDWIENGCSEDGGYYYEAETSRVVSLHMGVRILSNKRCWTGSYY